MVTAAAPWAALTSTVLARTNFFHYATRATVHGDHPNAMRLLGQTAGNEMVPSIYAKHLFKCLGTVQPEPVSVGTGGNALEAISFQGRTLPNVTPLQAKANLNAIADRLAQQYPDSNRHVGADVVELHTGAWCLAVREKSGRADALLQELRDGAAMADALGLEVHAGHGIDYETVGPIAAIPQVEELNIGHFLVGEAIFTGLEPAIRRMRALMDAARDEAAA